MNRWFDDIEFFTKLPDGAPCHISMRWQTQRRLSDTCFRGGDKEVAGNFAFWHSFQEMLADEVFLDAFLADILDVIEYSDVDDPDECPDDNEPDDERWNGGRNSTHRLTIEYPEDVGWDSAVNSLDSGLDGHWCPKCRRPDSRLVEWFNPNYRKDATALRVRLNRKDVLAPLTDCITLVYQIKFESGIGWKVIVHTVYPGDDIGPLRGNISNREGIVMFDFKHPGEPWDEGIEQEAEEAA